jgi:hypothetical protein
VLLNQLEQKCGGSGGKPVAFEDEPVFDEQQNIKGVVDFISEKIIPVVPFAYLLHIHPGKMIRKGCFQVVLGVTADSRKCRAEGDIFEIVEPAEY